MSNLHRPAHQLAADVAAGEVTSRTLVDECIATIELENPELNAAQAICADQARAAANRIDQLVRDGHSTGPLAGVPILIKDNLNTAGVATTTWFKDPGRLYLATGCYVGKASRRRRSLS